MFKEFLLPLTEYFSFLNIFQYITFRAAYAAITALFISFIFGPWMIKKLQKWKAGQEVRVDGPQTHLVKAGTPTMGGILIIFSVVISVILWQDIHNVATWIGLGSLLLFGGIGFVDDYLKVIRKNSDGLRAKFKFSAQILISLAIVLFLYFTGNEETTYLYLPFLKFPVVDLSMLYIPLGVIYLTGLSNAVNLTDGLDGLATGLLLFVSIALAVLCYITGRVDFSAYLGLPYIPEAGELTILSTALVGACIGFLWYNAHPAEVFMGDTGSLGLGGVIGVVALLIKKEVLVLIVGGVFVIEVASVMIQVISYKLRKKRVFKMAPLHHHFELKGWDETKVVIRFWILGGLFVILSLSTLKIQ